MAKKVKAHAKHPTAKTTKMVKRIVKAVHQVKRACTKQIAIQKKRAVVHKAKTAAKKAISVAVKSKNKAALAKAKVALKKARVSSKNVHKLVKKSLVVLRNVTARLQGLSKSRFTCQRKSLPLSELKSKKLVNSARKISISLKAIKS